VKTSFSGLHGGDEKRGRATKVSMEHVQIKQGRGRWGVRKEGVWAGRQAGLAEGGSVRGQGVRRRHCNTRLTRELSAGEWSKERGARRGKESFIRYAERGRGPVAWAFARGKDWRNRNTWEEGGSGERRGCQGGVGGPSFHVAYVSSCKDDREAGNGETRDERRALHKLRRYQPNSQNKHRA